jgi:hypothetical protein
MFEEPVIEDTLVLFCSLVDLVVTIILAKNLLAAFFAAVTGASEHWSRFDILAKRFLAVVVATIPVPIALRFCHVGVQLVRSSRAEVPTVFEEGPQELKLFALVLDEAVLVLYGGSDGFKRPTQFPRPPRLVHYQMGMVAL